MHIRSVFLGLLVATSSLISPAQAVEQTVVVLKAAHLFDALSGTLMEPGMVVVAGEKIQALGRELTIPAGAQVIDLGDATLMPGFIDAHVHMAGEMSNNWYGDWFNGMMRFPAEQALYGAHYASVTLLSGVTTVRDLGSADFISLGMRNAIRAGMIPGPRMLVANYPIGATGGHGDSNPIPPERTVATGVIQGVCNGADSCRAAVRSQIKYGADVIKLMPSGGVLSLTDPVDTPELTQEEINAIVSEAHAWNRKAAAHCHGDKAAKMAIAAGVDSIEHGSFLQDDTLLEMKKKHIYLVPTLSAGDTVGLMADKLPPAIGVKATAASQQMQKMFQRAIKLGVPVAMGTDAGVGHHGTNAYEFVLMTRNGYTPAQALISGTANGADLLGIAAQTGTLQVGKYADIVAVPGNVLSDISATQRPVLVMKEGHIYLGGK